MPANRVSAITVRPRKRRTDSDSAALGPEGRCASGWEPPLRGGRRHFPHWASSMKGVLRTRGWQPVTGGPDHESRATSHRFMPLAKSEKCPLHDRFGRATRWVLYARESAQTPKHLHAGFRGVPIDPPAGRD